MRQNIYFCCQNLWGKIPHFSGVQTTNDLAGLAMGCFDISSLFVKMKIGILSGPEMFQSKRGVFVFSFCCGYVLLAIDTSKENTPIYLYIIVSIV